MIHDTARVTQSATPGGVTVVTRTRVRAGKEDEFANWQRGIGAAVAKFSDFIEQTVPPNPPCRSLPAPAGTISLSIRRPLRSSSTQDTTRPVVTDGAIRGFGALLRLPL